MPPFLPCLPALPRSPVCQDLLSYLMVLAPPATVAVLSPKIFYSALVRLLPVIQCAHPSHPHPTLHHALAEDRPSLTDSLPAA